MDDEKNVECVGENEVTVNTISVWTQKQVDSAIGWSIPEPKSGQLNTKDLFIVDL